MKSSVEIRGQITGEQSDTRTVSELKNNITGEKSLNDSNVTSISCGACTAICPGKVISANMRSIKSEGSEVPILRRQAELIRGDEHIVLNQKPGFRMNIFRCE